jgi:hypothetical protein
MKKECICKDFAENPAYANASVSFKCPKHGEVALDRRELPRPPVPQQPISRPISDARATGRISPPKIITPKPWRRPMIS